MAARDINKVQATRPSQTTRLELVHTFPPRCILLMSGINFSVLVSSAMPQVNRMNRDQSDVMNNETSTVNNGMTESNGAAADTATRIPVPHGLDDLEVQEWLESLDSLLESSGPEVATEILERLRPPAPVSGIALPLPANTPHAHTHSHPPP